MGVTLQLLYLHNQSRSEENNDLLVNHFPKREVVQLFFICLFFNDFEAIRVAITGHDRQDHPTEEGYYRKRGGGRNKRVFNNSLHPFFIIIANLNSGFAGFSLN